MQVFNNKEKNPFVLTSEETADADQWEMLVDENRDDGKQIDVD